MTEESLPLGGSESSNAIREIYKGRTITIHMRETATTLAAEPADIDRRIEVAIDSKSFEVEQRGGAFESILMPHRSYDSALSLAKDVVDYHPSFRKR